jgi:hypothetical protein
MDDYICWNKHGEEGVNIRDQAQDAGQRDGQEGLHENDADGEEAPCGYEELSDDDVVEIAASPVPTVENLEEMVRDAFGFDEYSDWQFKRLKQLLVDMKTPLHPSCNERYTRLTGTLKLLQLKAAHHWTDKSFRELLETLIDMFPEGNQMPRTTYEAKKIVCPMGLKFEKIDACKNDCILFRGKDYEKLHACPKCGTSRYKQTTDEGDDGEVTRRRAPRKVAWYFPIIPRLKRLFATSKDAQLLSWHSDGRKVDGYIRHPADGIQWRFFDFMYKSFSDEPRNLRLALSTDGMNPFGNMSSSHSVWPVLLTIYNLPPWLCNKRRYMMMSVLISGPFQPGINIDVYLRPLIDDLKKLWNEEGVRVYDGFRKEYFNLRAMVFTTITDIPGHRSVSGQSKGEKDCFQCLDDTETVWLNNSKKRVYVRHRRFLPKSHPYRGMKCQFDGTRETGFEPRHFSGQQVYDQVVKDTTPTVDSESTVLGKRKCNAKDKKRWKIGKRKRNAKDKKRWKKMSILWELPYWKHLAVRHSIDLMHVKKNVCASLLGTLMNDKWKTKDHGKARADLEELDIRPELCPNSSSAKPALAAINLTQEERQELCDFFRSVKVPSGYATNIRKLVPPRENKMLPMKAHDCDVMLTTMLAVGIRNILPEKTRRAIMSLCFFFNTISQKVLDEQSLDDLEKNIYEVMCLLEAYFPPTFFDISVHLIIHLVKEIKFLGPMFLHHMYPYERFMSTLNRYAKSRVHPEGSMAQCYSTEEVVDWCLSYIDPTNPIGISKSRHEGRLAGRGCVGEKQISPDPDDFERAKFLVLQHTKEVEPYIKEHMEMLRQQNPHRGAAWLARAHMSEFNNWFKVRLRSSSSCPDKRLRQLAEGPFFTVTTYQGYDINGYTFYTINQDKKSMYQNSVVRVDAFDSNMHKAIYYGQIEEIWELLYPGGFKVAVFRCRWVQGSAVQKDNYGFTTVDLTRVGFREEPFVLASQVSQVFYVRDTRNKRRQVVLPGKKRVVGVENQVNEEEFNQSNEIPPFDTSIIPVISESEQTPYLRNGCKEDAPMAKRRQKQQVHTK